MPALDPTSTGGLALPTSGDASGVELTGDVIADHRNDRVEATDGWLLSARGSYAPGGPLSNYRWLQIVTDARAFHPLDDRWSIGARVSSGWVVATGDDGVPLGPRLFGGGTYGMRGYGRDHLSPFACAMAASTATTGCQQVLVGGRSLVESSLEVRYLPFRKQYGAAAFVDAGGAGGDLDAFAGGIAMAAGVGARLRLWYVPIALDVAYRFMDETTVPASSLFDNVLVFFRIGEAF
jgi:translocation and assembly module TamA